MNIFRKWIILRPLIRSHTTKFLQKKLTERLIIKKGKSTQTTREKSKVESIIASASIFAKSI